LLCCPKQLPLLSTRSSCAKKKKADKIMIWSVYLILGQQYVTDNRTPPDGSSTTTDETNDNSNLVAKVLNCSLSTGLYRRNCTKSLVKI
jgi:hypothetical protein